MLPGFGHFNILLQKLGVSCVSVANVRRRSDVRLFAKYSIRSVVIMVLYRYASAFYFKTM